MGKRRARRISRLRNCKYETSVFWLLIGRDSIPRAYDFLTGLSIARMSLTSVMLAVMQTKMYGQNPVSVDTQRPNVIVSRLMPHQ